MPDLNTFKWSLKNNKNLKSKSRLLNKPVPTFYSPISKFMCMKISWAWNTTSFNVRLTFRSSRPARILSASSSRRSESPRTSWKRETRHPLATRTLKSYSPFSMQKITCTTWGLIALYKSWTKKVRKLKIVFAGRLQVMLWMRVSFRRYLIIVLCVLSQKTL